MKIKSKFNLFEIFKIEVGVVFRHNFTINIYNLNGVI